MADVSVTDDDAAQLGRAVKKLIKNEDSLSDFVPGAIGKIESYDDSDLGRDILEVIASGGGNRKPRPEL